MITVYTQNRYTEYDILRVLSMLTEERCQLPRGSIKCHNCPTKKSCYDIEKAIEHCKEEYTKLTGIQIVDT